MCAFCNFITNLSKKGNWGRCVLFAISLNLLYTLVKVPGRKTAKLPTIWKQKRLGGFKKIKKKMRKLCITYFQVG